jgi:hypothetical protein
MLNNTKIVALYEANKVHGRSHLDPRKGIYKVKSIHQGNCFGKPATLATANWKRNDNDAYTEDYFTVQLETLKVGLSPLNTTNIVGREIKITSATWHPLVPIFCVTWEILPKEKSMVDKLNDLLAKGMIPNLDSFDEFEGDDLEIEEEY